MQYIDNGKNTIINKPHMSIIFLGHVDHGKSTICGNILYSLGLIDDRKIERLKEEANKNGMASWWLAYVMDQFEEEKEKGKTIEVGRATFETEKEIHYIGCTWTQRVYQQYNICPCTYRLCDISYIGKRQ